MMAKNFQPKHVAFLLPVQNVVFPVCNIHLYLIMQGHVSFQSRKNNPSFLYKKRYVFMSVEKWRSYANAWTCYLPYDNYSGYFYRTVSIRTGIYWLLHVQWQWTSANNAGRFMRPCNLTLIHDMQGQEPEKRPNGRCNDFYGTVIGLIQNTY